MMMTATRMVEDNHPLAASPTGAISKDDQGSSAGATASTASMTPAAEDKEEGYFKEKVPASNSALSSTVSLDNGKNRSTVNDCAMQISNIDSNDAVTPVNSNDDDIQEDRDDTSNSGVLNESIEYPISNSCSAAASPYQAFLFSADWLGSGEGLQLPDISRSSSSKNNRSDDEGSVMSGAYFEAVDLDSSNWKRAISMGPTFGFALVALATAFVHPVLFVGAAFAFGTLHAAGVSFDYCGTNNTTTSDINNNNKAANTTKLSTTDIAASWEQALLSICYKELPVEEAEKVIADFKEPAVTAATVAAAIEAETQVASESLIFPPPPSNEPAVMINEVADKSIILAQQDPALAAAAAAEPIQKQQQQLPPVKPLTNEQVEQIYVSLDISVVKDVSFPGLHAIEFFRVFFADDAPYNFKELQKKRGDLDIHYGQWGPLGPEEPVLLHSDASNHSPSVFTTKSNYQGRALTFKAKTNNFVGPLYANTRKTQRILLHHKTLIVMESRTDLKEIPFCDRFYVLERWVVRATKVQDGLKYKWVSTLSATSQVMFTQSCSFAGQIKTKSASTIKELVKCWCAMATEALKLAEQHKKLRLQHEQEFDSDVENESENEEEEVVGCGDATTKENAPPLHHHEEEEGIEMTWPVVMDVGASSHAGRKPKLKHSGSFPLPVYRGKGKAIQGIRRSVSSLFTNSSNKR